MTDSAGGVLPGASVIAVDTATKDKYETVTNQAGQYNIPSVRLGQYEITVSLTGFKTVKSTGIGVAGNQVVRTDVVLGVGGVAETVLVEAKATVLHTDRAAISQTVDARAIASFPLNGRNVWDVASSTPGVLAGQTSDIGLTFRGAGQRDIQNSLTLDGISSSSNLLAATSMRPIAEAVAEVQVQTGSTSAEYGSYLGVHINVVTKSGTNQFHGSGFEYFQSDALDQRGYFEDRSVPANPRKRNQFGVQADGPVLIPGVYNGRNRTFFMGAFEGLRSEVQSSPFLDLPTLKMRQGDFSEASGTILNPFTRQPFPNNQIPQSMISPVAVRLLNYYPLPNLNGTFDNYQGPALDNDETDQLLMRVDQNIGNHVRLYGRYNWQDGYDTLSASPIEIQNVYQPRVNKNYLFSYTHTLGSRFHNDFRIGYHTIDFDTLNAFWVNGQEGAGAALGIPGFDDTQYRNPGLPVISITDFTGLGSGGTNWFQFDKTFQLSNVLSHTRGSHNIRAGVDVRKLQTGRQAQNSARGSFTFNGGMTGYSVADFMLGLPRTVVTPADQLQGHVGHWRNGFFINDVWSATSKMTLSLGLRYELNTPVQTYAGLATMLDDDMNTIIPTTLPSPGFEFHDPKYNEIAPRLGATYRLTSRTVLRGGWGIYYNPNQMNTFTFLTNNPPLAAQFTFSSDPLNPTLSFANPSGVVGPSGPPNMITPNRDLPSARKNQWSFDLQQELFAATVLDIQYLASRTNNLDRSYYPNTPQPGPGAIDPRRPNQKFREIRVIQNDLIANYDSLAFILRRRMTNGLQANAHYTWSRTRDMANHSNAGGRIVNNFDIWSDYGPAAWDVPHRLALSYIYEVPFFRTSSNAVLRSVLGGWQVSGVSTFQSGTPLNVVIQGDRANTTSPNQRPDVVGNPSVNCESNPSGLGLINCIDPAAFVIPAQFTYGNAPRNMLRGLGSKTTDLLLIKSFEIGGSALQIRAEVFNLFNTVNWGSPNTTLGAAAFGRVASTSIPMRQMQLGAKLIF
ncbi:MAG: TonB-dependent receptor [Vicinamibacterales bacterium]